MNKQIDKQTNKQTTKLDDIHNIHIKMLYILWERESVRVWEDGVSTCRQYDTYIRIVWAGSHQEYSIGKSTVWLLYQYQSIDCPRLDRDRSKGRKKGLPQEKLIENDNNYE